MLHYSQYNLIFSIFILLVLLWLSGCSAGSQKHPDRKATYALKNADQTQLLRSYQSQLHHHKGKSGFVLLGSGLDAFAARTELFNKAEKSIDVQYYIVRDDLTGFLFYESLKKAADRGVRVRVLLDDFHLSQQTAKLAALDLHPNIEVRVFNPFSRKTPRVFQYIFQMGKVTRRMHNKLVVIDNDITIVGSRNIGNEYSEAEAERVFSGMEVLAIGPIAKEVSKSFDQYWNFYKTIKVSTLSAPSFENEKYWFKEDSERAYFTHVLDTSPLAQQIKTGTLPFRWAVATVIKDDPSKIDYKDKRLSSSLEIEGFDTVVKQTENNILIITPYFIPSQRGLQYFQKLCDKGLNVRVLTNTYASTDMTIVNAHYNKYRKDLLRMGVHLYEFKSVKGSVNLLKRARRLLNRPAKAALHAKIVSFDRNKLYVGSMNMDPRSLYENTEIGIMISSKDITNHIVQWFDQHLDKLAFHLELEGDNIIWQDYANNRFYTKEPNTVLSQRIWMRFMSILPVESQL
ncbi:MAG: phospholipase D family protein [Thiotrichaceae bacterium]|nr:phospholipase D family protein [Thiotrichaceae bacterium]